MHTEDHHAIQKERYPYSFQAPYDKYQYRSRIEGAFGSFSGRFARIAKVGARQVHSLLVAIGHGATFLPLLVLSLYLLLFSFQKLSLRSLYVSASFGS